MRRRAVVGGLGSVAAALVVGGAVATGGPGRGLFGAAASPPPSTSPGAAKTAEIERRTITNAEDLDGTLGYDGSATVVAGTSGTLTWMPSVGTVVKPGQPLFELDGSRRPRLFLGGRPFWRTLEAGISNGADIQELEANLKALGYAPKGMTVDRHWDSDTTTAVKRWEKATHQDRDGIVELGDVVVLPMELRVTERAASLGSPAGPGTPILQATSATKVVTLGLSASRRNLLQRGDAVTITLPDDTQIAGLVRSIGRVATTDQSTGTTIVPVTISLDDPAAAPDLDQATVTVHVVTERHENVLVVPVDALVALLEGGYAVEVVDDAGGRRYVGVTLGLFEDGQVEISGQGLEAGDRVVVPA